MSNDRTPPIRSAIRNASESTLALAWWQIALVAALALALALGILNGLTAIFRPLVLLALAVVIASAVEPLVRRLARLVPRTAATVIVYVAVLLVFVAIGWFAVPRVAQQATQLANDLPRLLRQGQQVFSQWDPTPGNRTLNLLFSQVGNLAGGLAQLPMTIFSMLLDIVIVFFLSLFWSIFLPDIRRFVLALFAPQLRDDADDVIQAMGHYT
ncbi:MAG TPA: AI-2E family transporter, partial [Chloroflexota bacterium]|nr:AI-2E family transporter [Chloroflexota bacterium]